MGRGLKQLNRPLLPNGTAPTEVSPRDYDFELPDMTRFTPRRAKIPSRSIWSR